MAAAVRKPPKEFGSYVRGKLLGSGAFAQVYACRRAEGEEQIFAAKAVDLQALRLTGRADRELRTLQREASILKRLPPHPNVVRFVDVVESEGWMYFVLEYVSGGNLLQSLMRRKSDAYLKEEEVLTIFRQLAGGLRHLHEQGVIHRDLKLENVLVAQEGTARRPFEVRITDFGLSKEVGEGRSAACSNVGSPKYVAPEVLTRGTHDFRADLWSLGVLLFVLLGRRFPFDGEEAAAVVAQAKLDAEVFKLKVSEEARSVLLGLLRLDSGERLSLEQLEQHQWLVGPASADDRAGSAGAGAKRPRRAAAKSPAAVRKAPPAAKAPAGGRGSTKCGSGSGARTACEGEEADGAGAEAGAAAGTGTGAQRGQRSPRAAAAEEAGGRKLQAQLTWVDLDNPAEAEALLEEHGQMVQEVTSMGFDGTMAEVVLREVNWNVQAAVARLLEDG
eukprot:TRINITY_DN727_c0_g3_i2.p1 TRINITY_DN727_c0_g3~~TRINITY_DN727_c0_g3_i2.p1  ORF type:complete len:494 (-),score=136.04 TRINITY_DN727_c0_g3_i2:115-1452(-)